MLRGYRLFFLVIAASGIYLFSQASVSLAQSSYIVSLNPPDTRDYPHLTAYLDVHNLSGEFIHGLTAQDVVLQENGSQVGVTQLVETTHGVQFVMAISPGSTFTTRDGAGISRYEYLLQGLLAGAWMKTPSGNDDLSLLTTDGPLLSHKSDPASMQSALESYTPALTDAASTIEVLSSAVQIASDPLPRPGMERAILFITSPLSADASPGLQSIISAANQSNIHIFVWMVAPPESFELPEAALLHNLASQTQATFFAFSRDESVPDLETLLETMRYAYQLKYDSQATASGAQQVTARVTIENVQVDSQPQTYQLNFLAPALVILDPPAEIVRNFIEHPTPDATGASAYLEPQQEQLNIQVSFPDGYVRPLARTTLYVDGAMVAERTAEPFDQMIWDLRPYTQEGSHTLRIEAVDTWGWVGKTGELSIKVLVPSASQELATAVSQKRILIIGITVFVTASILILVLIMGGRIRPRPYPGQFGSAEVTSTASSYWQRLRRLRDPVTQPIKLSATPPAKRAPRARSWREYLPWVRPAEKLVQTLAFLTPLVGTNEPTLPAALQITEGTVTLGTDVQKSNLVIPDPSIEGLHAKICQEGASFLIMDMGSVAGTWVNYTPVMPAGTLLEHGDIIHLGRVGFRFNLPEPGAARTITVTPLEPDR